jgi:pimeloyl-ACP methyl ester carboxylesterase
MNLLFQEPKILLYYAQLKLTQLKHTKITRREQRNRFPSKPILVIPGMASSDVSTKYLRKYLDETGLLTYGWGLGRNNGQLSRLIPLLVKRIAKLSEESEPLTLVGWSLGGILGREIARQIPQHVKAICCLGTPIVGGPKHTIYASYYKRKGFDLVDLSDRAQRREEIPLIVPSHVIYSKNDGIVEWEACIDPYNSHTTHTEVQTPHFSMGFSLEVFDEMLRWLEHIYIYIYM